MMRVLLKDKSDNTIFVSEITGTGYDPELQELYLYANSETFTVKRIAKINADSVVQELFAEGKSDLTLYETEIDEDD